MQSSTTPSRPKQLLGKPGGFERFPAFAVLVDRGDPASSNQKDVPLPHLDLGGASLSASAMSQPRHHPVAGVEKLERLRTEVVDALLDFGDQPLHSLDAVKDLLSWVFGGAMPFDIGCVEGRVGFPSPSEVLVAPSNQIKVLLRHRQLSISRRPLLPRPHSSLAPSR